MDRIYELTIGIFEGFTSSQMHLIVMFSAVAVCILAGYVGYWLYRRGKQLQEEDFGEKVYKQVEDTFRIRRSSTYEKLQRWLKATGAEYTVKGFGDPFKFLIANALLMIGIMIIFTVLSGVGAGVMVSCAVIVTEVLMIVAINQKHNKEMLDDISFLYDATAIQLTSNIYVVQAVYNCLIYIRSKRLKQALTELCGNLAVGGDVRTATTDFCEKFDNQYLDTFCNALVQITAETGEAGKLIEDMSKQLMVLKETTFAERKKSTENKLQL